jgi:hypothetical protein
VPIEEAGYMAQRIDGQKEHPQPFWDQDDWPQKRVQEHLKFHEDNKNYSQKISRLLDGTVLIVSASIPVVAATSAPKAVLAALGALVAVLTGLGHQFGWKENWIRQNRVVMAIHQELVWYRNGRPPYDGGESNNDSALLALRVEDIVQSDADMWASRIERGTDGGPESGDRVRATAIDSTK